MQVDKSVQKAIDEMKLVMLRALCGKVVMYCQISARKGRPLTWNDVKGMTIFNDAAENVLLGDPAATMGNMLGGINQALPAQPVTQLNDISVLSNKIDKLIDVLQPSKEN
mgnify:FL=1